MAKKRVQKNKKEDVKESLSDKVSSNESTIDNKNKENKQIKKAKDKMDKSKKSGFFFWKLSKVGQFTLIVLIIVILVFGGMFINSLIKKGEPQMGSRQLPAKEISTEQVDKIKSSIESEVKGLDSLDVRYNAFRLVIIMDLKDSASKSEAKDANKEAYKIVNKVTPINTYFYNKDKLNNDLYIYSTDVVPTNYDTDSKYIYETYRNSNMTSAETHNLLTERDAKSKKQVEETMKKAIKDGNK
ncbi:MAG: hypothetical protein RR425_00710 [Erysipelotrichales bacterium]